MARAVKDLDEAVARISRGRDELRLELERLAAEWRQATALTSSASQMFLHRAYQRIIGLGPGAVPLLLEQMADHPDHWGWALRAITGVDPVPPEAAGRLETIRDAWLSWGRARGLCR